MKILLTNDDGVDAPGLKALWECVLRATEICKAESLAADRDRQKRGGDQSVDLVVVAPDRGRSECSHSLETGRGLTIKTTEPGWYALDGTPVDCIRVAVEAMGFRPDAVFSGINAGANLGVNLMVSGTFAAAREANLMGIPALAASHYRHPDVPRTWDHCSDWIQTTLVEFLRQIQFEGELTTESDARSSGETPSQPPLWNVNLPAVTPEPGVQPPRIVCAVDRCPIERVGTIDSKGGVRFELDFHGRPRESGRDVDACFGGSTTISKLTSVFWETDSDAER